MRVVLIGADFEENLGMAMIAASLHAAGHKVDIVAFHDASQLDAVASRALKRSPDMVGLSMQFQHRGHEFLRLARVLRAKGYRGHVTCGGQYPTLAWREVLENNPAIDSIVLHEGEATVVELLEAIRARRPLGGVDGLAVRGEGRKPARTRGRPLCADLDTLPTAYRYRAHSTHVRVPFIPISGSRGCWGACTYCSITSFYRDARAYGGGRTLRMRSPGNIAREMAALWHAAGGQAVFCFHDDNFLMPRPVDSLERVRALRSALDEYGVGKVGIIGKCRPECLTAELALDLRDLGVVRLYVGVENASQAGSDHLNRKTQTSAVRAALGALRDARIFGCYNLLIFEPDATLEDVRANIAFIREHAGHPVNFCRAEPYHGTPLHRGLVGSDLLGGSYLGWDYRIRDDRTELLFRICAAAFRERNFAAHGVANRYMGLGYNAKLLEHFYDDPSGRRARIARRVDEVTRGIAMQTAELLEEALAIASRADLSERDAIERETVLLGLRVSAMDKVWHGVLDDLMDEMQAFAKEAAERRSPPLVPARRVRELVQGVAVASLLAVGGLACGGKSTVNDPVPSDAGLDAVPGDGGDESDVVVSDPLPEDGGVEADSMVADPPPWDAGFEDGMADPPPWDAGFEDGMADPPPWDAGFQDGMADPPPWDAGVDDAWADPPPPDYGLDGAAPLPGDASLDAKRLMKEHWRDTSPRRAVRSDDLPFYDPPALALAARRTGETIEVLIRGASDVRSTRVECEGEAVENGDLIAWTPESDDDQLRVAVRTKGGIAVATVRARDV